MRRSTIVLTVVLVFSALALHLSISWQDVSTLAKNGYLYDDSFYAFQIARNIANGDGATFDGITPTNGFQPLYVFLLVPVYKILGSDPATPIHAALTILALLTVATALLLFLILRRYVSEGVSLLSAFMWLFSPVVVKQSSNGLETALALFFIAWSAYYYLDRIRSNPAPGTGRFIKLGLLFGLTILARVDGILFVLATALDYLVVLRARAKSTDVKYALRGVGYAAVTAFAVYIPWAIFGVMTVGSPLQESAAATRFLSIAYAPFFDLGVAGTPEKWPGVSFVWAHIVHSFSVLKLSPPVHVFFRGVEKLTGGDAPTGALLFVVNVIGIAGLSVCVVRLLRSKGRNNIPRCRELTFLVLFSVLLIAAYSTYIFGVFFFTRYLYPVYFVATVYAAFILQDAADWIARKRLASRVAVACAAGVYVVALVYMGLSAGFRSTTVYHFYDIARWVEQNTEENETIGVFQGGAIGYFSNRRVVNLDGKVNGDALVALRNGDIDRYVSDAGIDVVVDHTDVLALFFREHSEAEFSGMTATRCFDGDNIGAKGWIGYRMNGSGADVGGGAGSPSGASRSSQSTVQ